MITEILFKKEKLTVSDCARIAEFVTSSVKNNGAELDKVFEIPIEKFNMTALKCIVRYTMYHHEVLPNRKIFVKNILQYFKDNKISCKIHFKGLNSELL